MAEPARPRVTLAELLAVLSLATDLGLGQPMEHVLRECLIALRLADRLGLDAAEQEVVYYSALIAWVGCHVDAYEQAKWFGDDTALKSDFRHTDFASYAAKSMFMLRHLGAGRSAAERAKLGVAFLGEGRKAAEAMLDNHWTAADANSRPSSAWPSGSATPSSRPLNAGTARGPPRDSRKTRSCSTARMVSLADVVEVFHRAGGIDAAVKVARQRRGTQFDPAIVDLLRQRPARSAVAWTRPAAGTRC